MNRLERDIIGAQRCGLKVFINLKEITEDNANIEVISDNELLR